MNDQFYTPSLLIADYCDSLIREIDIYTEELMKPKNKEKKKLNISKCRYSGYAGKNRYNIETFENPYIEDDNYTFDSSDLCESLKNTKLDVEYLNKVRTNAIEQIRMVQEHNLELYNDNKERFKVDRENLTEEKLEELKSNLFAEKFCILVNVKKIYTQNGRYPVTINRDSELYTLHTVITDFYLSESDIDFIR